MSITHQIKDNLDIVQYIQQYVPDLKQSGRYYKACCPFHQEKTPSFVVNADTQSWRCFGQCAEGGDIFTFAQKFHGWSFKEALEELGRAAGVEVRQMTPEQRERSDQRDRLRGMLKMAAELYHEYLIKSPDEASAAALQYAREKRGFTDDTLVNWQIGYAPDRWNAMLDKLREIGYDDDEIVEAGLARRSDRTGNLYDTFRHRLMIPICDDRGRVVGFGARALDPAEKAKYINSSQSDLFDKSKLLFGLDRAKNAIRDADTAVVVEGYMDVIQAHQAGYHNVVAQMGTALTEVQLKKLVSYAQNVLLALDSDAAGQNATRRSLEVARQTLESDYMGRLAVDIRILQLEGAKDPDDILRETPELWAQAVSNAVPVTDFVIEMETQGITSASSIAERQSVARRILPLLMATESDVYRGAAIQSLALRLHIGEADLQMIAQDVRRDEKAKAERNRAARERREQSDTPPEGAPPPLTDEPPPWLDEDDQLLPVVDGQTVPAKSVVPEPPQLASRNASRATEAFCVRMLISKPELLFRLNRRLRELAEEDDTLISGPLEEFQGLDFSQTDYRHMLELLLEAMRQHDLDPQEYVQQNMEHSLKTELDRLVQTEYQLLQQEMDHRFIGELKPVIQQFQIRTEPSLNIDEIVLERLIAVRRQRLQRERDEIYFLMTEAKAADDMDAIRQYFRQMATYNRAWHRLNDALNQKPLKSGQYQ